MNNTENNIGLRAFVVFGDALTGQLPQRKNWFQWHWSTSSNETIERIVTCTDLQSAHGALRRLSQLGFITYAVIDSPRSPLVDAIYDSDIPHLRFIDSEGSLGEIITRLCHPEPEILMLWEDRCVEGTTQALLCVPVAPTLWQAYGKAFAKWIATLHEDDAPAFLPDPDRVFLRSEFESFQDLQSTPLISLLGFPGAWLEFRDGIGHPCGALAAPGAMVRLALNATDNAVALEDADRPFWNNWLTGGANTAPAAKQAVRPAATQDSTLGKIIDWFVPPQLPASNYSMASADTSKTAEPMPTARVSFGDNRIVAHLWKTHDNLLAIRWDLTESCELKFTLMDDGPDYKIKPEEFEKTDNEQYPWSFVRRVGGLHGVIKCILVQPDFPQDPEQ